MNKLFYRAIDGYTADIIPYYENGTYYLFYLKDFRNKEQYGEGTPWYLVTTNDFVDFVEHGEVIPRGGVDEQDLYIFTGSVFKESENNYHIFYTGHNPHLRAEGKPEQAVMHAVSADLIHWKKVPEDTFYAPAEGYEPHDWRDPFVFWNEETEQYWMLLAARTNQGPNVRRGCTALCVSDDLTKWEVKEPLWAPQYFFTHECPDLFRIGDWWYLVYSEFSDRCLTRYRMSKSLDGPWIAPQNDAFDGRAYYAAKTASDGNKRYLFGWNPTKKDQDDHNHWEWGGHLVVHEIYPLEDGTLAARLPDSIRESFTRTIFEQSFEVDAVGSFNNEMLSVKAGSAYLLSTTVTFDDQTTRAGVQLRYHESVDESYVFSLEISKHQACFHQFPIYPWHPANFTNVSRPIQLSPEVPYRLEILVEDDVCVLYINGRIALNARMHKHKDAGIAVFAMDGKASFNGLTIKTRE